MLYRGGISSCEQDSRYRDNTRWVIVCFAVPYIIEKQKQKARTTAPSLKVEKNILTQ
jgi:hypothetical protein